MKTTQTWKIGDCLQLLPEIPDKSIDMILTDLPYGTTACSWDIIIPFELMWLQYERIIKDDGVIALHSSQPFTSKLINSNPTLFKYCWYWEKERGTGIGLVNLMPLRTIEEICIFYKKHGAYHPDREPLRKKYTHSLPINKGLSGAISGAKSFKTTERIYATRTHKSVVNLLHFPRDNGCHGMHPTQKPIALSEYLIKTYTNEGDTVHDSCLGSGTTLEACANLNRNCIGFELLHDWEEHYRKRLKLDNTKLDAWTT